MLFNSFTYILFLWTVYVLFWSLRNKRSLRHAVVLVASYWFYAQAHWAYTSLLLISSVVDFAAGAGIQRARDGGREAGAKAWLGVSLLVNLGLLCTFKYFDFFVGAFEDLIGSMGFEASLWRLDLVLPVGISFYTFQTLSYTIDIYRGSMKPTKRFVDFAMYVAFFPQLVAGPIVRAADFLPQLESPRLPTRERIGSGLFQILQGLAKKLLMADVLASHLVDPIMADPAALAELDAVSVLCLAYGFTLQLYGDFAGYSDVAIGSARLLGFELRVNFDSPFQAASLDDFWRRWHISMSTWFRDYVFHALGGSRGKLARICFNTFLTFVLVGLWHGAAWTFVIYGAAQGVGLVTTRLFRVVFPDAAFRKTRWWWFIGWLMTWHWIALLGLLYRAPEMGLWVDMMAKLGDWGGVRLDLPWQVWFVLFMAHFTHFIPQGWVDAAERVWGRVPAVLQGAGVVAAILLFFGLHPPGITPFIYFQF